MKTPVKIPNEQLAAVFKHLEIASHHNVRWPFLFASALTDKERDRILQKEYDNRHITRRWQQSFLKAPSTKWKLASN